MKNLAVLMFITVFLLSILYHCTPATRQVKADFYISPNGSDSNPGTYEKPFATVTRARNAVRTMISAGLNEDVTVIIRGGIYIDDSCDYYTVSNYYCNRSYDNQVLYTNRCRSKDMQQYPYRTSRKK